MELSRHDLAHIGQLSLPDTAQLQLAAAQQLFPAEKLKKSIFSILQQHPPRRLSTGCGLIDNALGGGLPDSGGIVEVCWTIAPLSEPSALNACNRRGQICGEAGSGKTQLCIQILLQAQLPPEQGGLAGAGLFVSTKADSGKRHQDLLKTWQPKFGTAISSQNLLISKVGEPSELLRLVQRDFRPLIRAKNIKVVVIDSIASLVTGVYEQDEQDQKTKWLYTISRELKILADECHVLIVVTNHVSDFMGKSTGVSKQQSLGGCWMSGDRAVVPALGLFWTHCVSTRIILARTSRKITVDQGESNGEIGTVAGFDAAGEPPTKRRKTEYSEGVSVELRELRIQFSSFCREDNRAGFVITKSGIRGVE